MTKQDFDRLLELACKTKPVVVESTDQCLTTQNVMQLAESGGAFGYWNAPEEDVYFPQDGEPL